MTVSANSQIMTIMSYSSRNDFKGLGKEHPKNRTKPAETPRDMQRAHGSAVNFGPNDLDQLARLGP